MNLKFLNIGLSFVVAGMLLSGLTGCGSDSDDVPAENTEKNDDNDTGNTGNNDNDAINGSAASLVPYSCDKSTHGTGMKLGADGNFQVDCSDDKILLEFANNANSLTVTQVTQITTGTVTDEDGTGTFSNTSKFPAGTSKIVGNHSAHGYISCTETYDVSSIDKTIYAAYSVYNFTQLDDGLKLSTTCPDWVTDEDDDDYDDSNYKMNITSNVTVVDSTGTTSNITMNITQ